MDLSSELDQQYRKLLSGGIEAEAAISEIIRISSMSSIAIDSAKAAVILKEAKYLDDSAKVLDEAMTRYPKDSRLVLERSLVHKLKGELECSDRILFKGLMSCPEPNLILREAIMRVASGRFCLHEYIKSDAACGVAAAALRVKDEYLKNASIYVLQSCGRISKTVEHLQNNPPITPDEMHKVLISAVDKKSPFCFLRLGDGEGAILQALQNNIYGPFSQRNGERFESRWFGSSSNEVHKKVMSVASELESRVSEADIVGIPQYSWIARMLRDKQMPAVFNAIEASDVAIRAGISKTADVGVCLAMEQRGLLLDVVRHAGKVDLITSRRDLGAALSDAVGVAVGTTYLIPPPSSDPGSRDGELSRGDHLFGRFDELRGSLDVAAGSVVLIAAGFLGKIYALDIKRQGGIAIDIGHVADRWVGYESRPESKGPNISLRK